MDRFKKWIMQEESKLEAQRLQYIGYKDEIDLLDFQLKLEEDIGEDTVTEYLKARKEYLSETIDKGKCNGEPVCYESIGRLYAVKKMLDKATFLIG